MVCQGLLLDRAADMGWLVRGCCWTGWLICGGGVVGGYYGVVGLRLLNRCDCSGLDQQPQTNTSCRLTTPEQPPQKTRSPL